MPSHAVEILAKLRAWTPTFESTYGRPPTMEECSEYVKTSLEQLRIYMENSADSVSLDTRISRNDGESTLLDVVIDDTDLMDDLDMLVRSEYVDDLLMRLSETDRQIVEKHFALFGGEPLTLQAIGNELGISRERVRQRLARSVVQMRVWATRVNML